MSFIIARPKSSERFFSRHAIVPLNHSSTVTALKLLELQRHAMLMYTSCGWFFDDLSGIEAVQIIQYAARVVQFSEELFGESPECQFVEKLSVARSNLSDRGGGREIYEQLVRTAIVNWERIGTHSRCAPSLKAIQTKPQSTAFKQNAKIIKSLTPAQPDYEE